LNGKRRRRDQDGEAIARAIRNRFDHLERLSRQYGWRRLVSDFAQFLGFLQFFFGSMPELGFPPFGTSGPLPEFVSADSDMLLSRLWHDASSGVRSPVAVVSGDQGQGRAEPCRSRPAKSIRFIRESSAAR
jgi:hypothetical protein